MITQVQVSRTAAKKLVHTFLRVICWLDPYFSFTHSGLVYEVPSVCTRHQADLGPAKNKADRVPA